MSRYTIKRHVSRKARITYNLERGTIIGVPHNEYIWILMDNLKQNLHAKISYCVIFLEILHWRAIAKGIWVYSVDMVAGFVYASDLFSPPNWSLKQQFTCSSSCGIFDGIISLLPSNNCKANYSHLPVYFNYNIF